MFKNIDFKNLILLRTSVNFADSIFYIAITWYVSNIIKSPKITGIILCLFTLPELLTIFIGPIIDKIRIKSLLKFTIYLSFIFVVILYFIIDFINIYLLAIFVFIISFLSNITYPIEDTLIPRIVESENLIRANSYSSLSYQALDALFNAITGYLLVVLTIKKLISINILFLFIGIILVNKIKGDTLNQASDWSFNFKDYLRDFIEGLNYIKGSLILSLLIPLIFVNFFNASNSVLLPFFVNKYTNPAASFGLILGIKAIGCMIGTYLINKFDKKMSLGKLLAVLLLFYGVFWIAFLYFKEEYVSFILLLLAYVLYGMTNVIYSTLLQRISPSQILGRVVSTVNTIVAMAMPIGSLFAGWAYGKLDTKFLMSLSGIFIIITAITYFSNSKLMNLEL